MAYVVEKVFDHEGFKCAVAMMDIGHRCGYVGVPKGHKYYGKDYMDIDIDCHGGLTFSTSKEGGDYPIKEPNDYWWFGWDYAHYGDANDWDSFERNFKDVNKEIFLSCEIRCEFERIYYLDDVIEECKRVAEQLKEKNENI